MRARLCKPGSSTVAPHCVEHTAPYQQLGLGSPQCGLVTLVLKSMCRSHSMLYCRVHCRNRCSPPSDWWPRLPKQAGQDCRSCCSSCHAQAEPSPACSRHCQVGKCLGHIWGYLRHHLPCMQGTCSCTWELLQSGLSSNPGLVPYPVCTSFAYSSTCCNPTIMFWCSCKSTAYYITPTTNLCSCIFVQHMQRMCVYIVVLPTQYAVLHCRKVSMVAHQLHNIAMPYALQVSIPLIRYLCTVSQYWSVSVGSAELTGQAKSMAPRLGRGSHLPGA